MDTPNYPLAPDGGDSIPNRDYPFNPKDSDAVRRIKDRVYQALKASELRPKDPNPYAPQKHSGIPLSAFIPAEETKKKKARTNHNTRSRKFYELKGMTLTITESYSHLTMRSSDMMGIFDGVAVGGGKTLGVQICSKSSVSARRKKMQDSKNLARWIDGGNTAVILAWEKKPNGKNHRWIPTEIEVTVK